MIANKIIIVAEIMIPRVIFPASGIPWEAAFLCFVWTLELCLPIYTYYHKWEDMVI